MDIYRKPNGKWQVRWREGARRCGRTFDRKGDALDYMGWLRRRQQLGQAAVPDDVPLCEFIETYWRLHAVPNLSPATRDLYNRVWSLHIAPRLGDYGVRELTPKRLTRFRADLERAGVGTATVVKAMTIVQSIRQLRRQRGARRVQRRRRRDEAPLRARSRAAHLPPARGRGDPREARAARPHARLGPRVLRAPARGGRLPPHLERRRRARDPLRRHQAPPHPAHAAAEAAGRRPQGVVPRLGPADRHAARCSRPTTAASGTQDDWRNWRKRVWQGEPERPRRDRKNPNPATPRVRPERHPAARPAIELRDPPRLRGDPAHADRSRGRHEHPDDRAALRRRDRQLGRQTALRGGLDPSRQKGLHPGPASN